MAVGRIQFLTGCRTEDRGFVVAVGRGPLVLCHMAGRLLRQCQQGRQCDSKTDVTVLHAIIMEVTFPHLRRVHSLEASYRYEACSRGGDYTRVQESRGRDNRQSSKSLSGMTLQNCPKLCQGGQAFMPPHPPITGCVLSRGRLVTLGDLAGMSSIFSATPTNVSKRGAGNVE